MNINDDINYVENIIRRANSILNECVESNERWDDVKEFLANMVKTAFHAALSLCAKYSLQMEAKNIQSILAEADDLARVAEYDGTGVFDLYWGSRLYSELNIIKNLYGETTGDEIPLSLNLVIQMIRHTEYAMEAHNKYPRDETDLHKFIENILKPAYPDLLSKPPLPKPIKNFVPDTGIPSLRLLIEYKYLYSKEDASRVADEILADTAGYKSKDWVYFFLVIYEQRRLKSDTEWKDLLRQCGTAKNTWVFVIHGIPTVTDRDN